MCSRQSTIWRKNLTKFIEKFEGAFTVPSHGLKEGDHIQFHFDSARTRRRASKIVSEREFYVVTFVRPSRGFAKHNRRVKQEKS